MKDEKNPKPVTSNHGKAFTCYDTEELMDLAAQSGDAEAQADVYKRQPMSLT